MLLPALQQFDVSAHRSELEIPASRPDLALQMSGSEAPLRRDRDRKVRLKIATHGFERDGTVQSSWEVENYASANCIEVQGTAPIRAAHARSDRTAHRRSRGQPGRGNIYLPAHRERPDVRLQRRRPHVAGNGPPYEANSSRHAHAKINFDVDVVGVQVVPASRATHIGTPTATAGVDCAHRYAIFVFDNLKRYPIEMATSSPLNRGNLNLRPTAPLRSDASGDTQITAKHVKCIAAYGTILNQSTLYSSSISPSE